MVTLFKESNENNNEYKGYTWEYDSRDGYLVTEIATGRTFELYEGRSWKGYSTSDIVFFMETRNHGNGGYVDDGNACVGYVFGATINTIEDCIDQLNYELHHRNK